MIWTLVALASAGIGSAGIALILRSLTRQKLPKWIVPVFAGAGMLTYQIYSEYSWLQHKQTQLPPNSEVISVQQGAMVWRPWSYLYPLDVSFTVIDGAHISTTQVGEDRVAEFILYRFENMLVDSVKAAPHLLNCSNGQMLQLNEDHKPDLESLRELDGNDPLRQRICNGA